VSLFTTTEREIVKNELISLLTDTAEITAIILIGSAIKGYTDELSDIDIMSVVNSEADIISVMGTVSTNIKERYNILCFAQLDERRLQVYLIDNYLELNFSYRTIETLEAKADCWQVLYDKTGTIDSIMHSTYEKFKETNHVNTNNTYQNKLAEYSEQIWHFLFHAAAAINRGRFWKVVKELDYARNNIIELKGLRYSLSMHRNSDVDKIPKEELALLQKTLPSLLTKEALIDNLKHLIDAAYNELEINQPNPHITVTRQQAIDYLTQSLYLKP
jgi:predicted nucleotidyltransferase